MRGKGLEGKYFFILADEAVDISNKEHLSVVSRFVDSEKSILLGFTCVPGLSMDDCRGPVL